jgi:hypothetical protein
MLTAAVARALLSALLLTGTPAEGSAPAPTTFSDAATLNKLSARLAPVDLSVDV